MSGFRDSWGIFVGLIVKGSPARHHTWLISDLRPSKLEMGWGVGQGSWGKQAEKSSPHLVWGAHPAAGRVGGCTPVGSIGFGGCSCLQLGRMGTQEKWPSAQYVSFRPMTQGLAKGLYFRQVPMIAQLVKNPPAMQETLVQFLGRRIHSRRVGY